MIGQTLAHYRVTASIGAGGMGQVYRATDTTLGREVAIKVLPEGFSRDRDKLARFEREAHLLASLNHPNIATIYGFEEAKGEKFLVMELVEGETLAERLASGPMRVDEALPLFQHIAEGLEAAHEKGIIHRDLKPANIKIAPSGQPKILDFGLAKAAFLGDVSADSPTITREGTEIGVILGTAAYMSPEQARGQSLDRRTDIWSFGCVFFEALTGIAPFLGETVSDTIARILEREPDWSALPGNTPPPVRRLLRRCLKKDPGRRLHDVADVRIELEETLEGSPESVAVDGERQTSRRNHLYWMVAGVAVILAGAATGALWRSDRTENSPMLRASLHLPALGASSALLGALSPDGSRMVYRATTGERSHLYLRALDRDESTPIAGAEGGSGPFFSPDGDWLGFIAGRKLKKVRLDGAEPAVVLCDAPTSRGADWSVDGTIVFSVRSSLMRVPASGGAPESLTSVDPDRGEISHYWPDVLPDGKAVIFTIVTSPDFDDSSIVVQSLESGERKFLLNASYARYAPTGHLIYAREDTLYAVPFDLDRLEVKGTGIPVETGVLVMSGGPGNAQFTFSDTGTLLFIARPPATRRVVLVDREGRAEPLAAPPLPYLTPRFSPDGRHLALSVYTPGDRSEIYVYELEHERLSLVASTLEGTAGEVFSLGDFMAWSPDGNSLAVHASTPQGLNLFSMAIDGSRAPERLTDGPGYQFPDAWMPNGERLVYTDGLRRGTQGWSIAELSLTDRTSRTVLDAPLQQAQPALSPDGSWMAYTSNESGRYEVYIVPFGQRGGRQQVSREGGTSAVWSTDGRELYYRDGGEQSYRHGEQMMRAAISTRPELSVGRPEVLFKEQYFRSSSYNPRRYDLAPDGKRFVFIQDEGTEHPPGFQIVSNWFRELERLVPVN